MSNYGCALYAGKYGNNNLFHKYIKYQLRNTLILIGAAESLNLCAFNDL